ncbi:ribosomal RNA-processing protein 8 [Sarcophilus harrisii]|uniref:Ribosomal RNA-processing protein 8 n=2 Tax=Sarcophilus harrisii TaxID=9305 RepID=G3W5Q0_SARHA
MFEEPEWAEEAPAPAARPPPIPRAGVKSAPRAKGFSRKQLQATLQALQAAALPYPLPNQEGNDSNSDSDVGEEKRKKRKKTPKVAPFMEENSKLPVQRVKIKKGESKGSGTPKNSDLVSVLPQKDPALMSTTHRPVEDRNTTEPRLSRKQWRNRQKNKRRQKNKFLPLKPQSVAAPEQETAPELTEECESTLEAKESRSSLDRGGMLRAKMKLRLEGARFRFLNEQLYSVTSSAASHIFQEDPEAFELYHRGFQNQIKRWPLKPVDQIVKDLKQQPASLVVADFGCGDCHLASSVRNTVHCFDLAALDPRVTVCDMAQVPLKDESVDIAVFCLSLMGTNLSDFLKEANRVLKPGGLLKIAEVASRFVDMRSFLGALAQLGFKLVSKDLTNSYFYLLNFHKTGPPKAQGPLPGLTLRPCLYKRR